MLTQRLAAGCADHERMKRMLAALPRHRQHQDIMMMPLVLSRKLGKKRIRKRQRAMHQAVCPHMPAKDIPCGGGSDGTSKPCALRIASKRDPS